MLPTASVTASTRPAIRSRHDVGTRPWGVPSPVQATALLVAITTIGAALSFYRIGVLSFWTDELFTAVFIDHPLNKIWGALWPSETNMILYYCIVHVWENLFTNPSDGTLRSISALCSTAAIPAVYALALVLSQDKNLGRAAGLVAALLFSLNSFRIQYSQELRSYSLALCFGVISSALFVMCCKKPKSIALWVVYVVSATAGIYSHDLIGLLIAAHVTSLLVLFVSGSRSPLIPAIVSYLVILLLISPLIQAAVIQGTAFLAWIKVPSLTDIVYFATQFTGGDGVSLLLFYLFGVMLTIVLSRRENSKYINDYWVIIFTASCLFLPFIVCMILTYSWVPFFCDRYFLPSLPYLTVFVAFGIARLVLSGRLVAKFGGAALLLALSTLSALGAANYYTTATKEDWRSLTAFLVTECVQADTLRLYYPDWSHDLPLHYSTQVGTQDRALEQMLEHPDADAAAAVRATDYRKICLIVSPEGSPEQRQTVRSLVQANYPKATPYKFAGDMEVDVYVK